MNTPYGRDPRLQARIDEYLALREAEIARIKSQYADEPTSRKVIHLRSWERENDFIKFVRPRDFA